MEYSQDTRSGGKPALLPQHAAMIDASAITKEVAEARGYRSVTTKADAARLGFGRVQQNVPALLVPVRGVTGEVVGYQLRPDTPRIARGKPIKYETPAGSRMRLDVPPAVRPMLGNPAVPLFVTEGVKKADAAASVGLACVALLGVWNWRGRNADDGTVALPDWESVALNGREVHACFDSDVTTKPAVAGALRRLKAFLESRGARVRVVYLPPLASGAKQGLDDFLAAGGTVERLLALAEDDVRPGPEQAGSGRFAVVGGRLCEMRRAGDGAEPAAVPLANFAAEIVAEVTTDDGQSERAELEIVGTLAGGESLPTVRVPLARFAAMRWPLEGWGVRAVVEPGFGNADRLRAAIQTLSQDVERRVVYHHPGWRRLADGWVFLHAGGALGADGPVPGVEVELGPPANGIALPDASDAGGLREAVRASLGLLGLAPDAVTAPVLGAAYRAPLLAAAPADVGVWVVGPTGSFKSELASLAQRHFGVGFDRLHLPGNWSATANATEKVLFDFKDCLVVVDDFAPGSNPREADRLHATAERIVRGVGNASGRGRLSADLSARPVFAPRGLLLVTGEDEPRGHSIRARLVLVEVEPGDIDATGLATAQATAQDGRLAVAMAGYVQWLADRYDGLAACLIASLNELRTQAVASRTHARTPEAVASLGLGWRWFLRFAVACGALSTAEAEATWLRAWSGLVAAGERQAGHQADQEPTRRFLDLLAAALASGEAHLAGPDGGEPTDPTGWGWRQRTVGTGDAQREEWQPTGKRVGWVDGDDAFLALDSALAVADRLGQGVGNGVPVGVKTLAKRLHQRGLLASVPDRAGELAVRRQLEGARRRVHHLRAASVKGDKEFGQSDQSDQPDDDGPGRGVGTVPRGRVPWPDSAGPDPESGHETVGNPATDAAIDRIGRIGRVSSPPRSDKPGEGDTLTRSSAPCGRTASPVLMLGNECTRCGAVAERYGLCGD